VSVVQSHNGGGASVKACRPVLSKGLISERCSSYGSARARSTPVFLLVKPLVPNFLAAHMRRDVGTSGCAARPGRYMMHRHNERDKVEVPDWYATRTHELALCRSRSGQPPVRARLHFASPTRPWAGRPHTARCRDRAVAVSELPARCSAGEPTPTRRTNPKPTLHCSACEPAPRQVHARAAAQRGAAAV